METTLQGRMKEYEKVTQLSLIKRQPVIIRLDGRAFKTFTKHLDEPFDKDLSDIFEYVCVKLREKIDNVKFMYRQSDEISILLYNNKSINTDCWYNNRLQKLVSVSASFATVYFNEGIQNKINEYSKLYDKEEDEMWKVVWKKKLDLWQSKLFTATFDSRAFNIPVDDVVNYFIYRQKDAIRNSKMKLAQCYFSHKQLMNISADEGILMVMNKEGIDWNEQKNYMKWGFCIYRNEDEEWLTDLNTPLFLGNREYIQKFL